MKVSNPEKVEPIIIDNGNIEKRILIGSKDGAKNFVMRLFRLKPGANTPYHTHDWEHEVYVLKGTLKVVSKDESFEAKAGNFVFVEPNEEHQFVNVGNDIASLE